MGLKKRFSGSLMPRPKFHSERFDSICIVRLSALGDCFLLVPMIHTLRLQYPEAKIYWVIERHLAPLFESLEGVKIIPINKPKSPLDYLRLKSRFSAYDFDLLIAAQASFRVNLVYPCIKAKTKIGFDDQRAKDLHQWFVDESIAPRKEHLLDGFLGFTKHLGIENPTIAWPLEIPAEATHWAMERLGSQDWIAINPAASKLERTPQASFYVDVIQKLISGTDYHIILTGGSDSEEVGLANAIVSSYPERVINLTGKTNLAQLTALMSAVDILISPDTGTAHIATAFGTPVVGLYAVAPPALSGPYLSQHLVINKFPEAVKNILGKDPEDVKWGTRVHDRKAMDFIQAEEVIAKVHKAMEELTIAKHN